MKRIAMRLLISLWIHAEMNIPGNSIKFLPITREDRQGILTGKLNRTENSIEQNI